MIWLYKFLVHLLVRIVSYINVPIKNEFLKKDINKIIFLNTVIIQYFQSIVKKKSYPA